MSGRSSGPSNTAAYALDRVDWNDPYSYIREMYGVPAREGARVTFIGAPATVIGTEGHYLVIDPELFMGSPSI